MQDYGSLKWEVVLGLFFSWLLICLIYTVSHTGLAGLNKLCAGLRIAEVGGGVGSLLLMATHLSHTHQGNQKPWQGKPTECITVGA